MYRKTQCNDINKQHSFVFVHDNLHNYRDCLKSTKYLIFMLIVWEFLGRESLILCFVFDISILSNRAQIASSKIFAVGNISHSYTPLKRKVAKENISCLKENVYFI